MSVGVINFQTEVEGNDGCFGGGEGGEGENQWSRARATSQIQSHSATPF